MNTKEKILQELEGKSVKDYCQEFCEAEERLIESLKKLNNWGKGCNCDECEDVRLIFHGSMYDEIQSYCLGCGGNLMI